MGKLTHDQAAAKLTAAGITWSSSGNCSDKNNKKCTSFDQINSETIEGILWLKEVSKCAVHITGGTEIGHATVPKENHGNGYKIDIRPEDPISDYIKTNFKKTSVRKSDKAEQWIDDNGNYYARELKPAHWDITFFNAPKVTDAKGSTAATRKRWVYKTGELIRLTPDPESSLVLPTFFPVAGLISWLEQPVVPYKGDKHYFLEVQQNENYLELYDASREISLQLHGDHGLLKVGKGGWKNWEKGSWK